jgi:hypothetical protein
MEEEWKDMGKVILVMCIIAISAILAASWVLGPTTTKIESTDSYEIWDLNAPFGRYWVDTNGRFIFASGNLDSEIQESYTIKYLVGDELKTVIVSSTDTNVHLYLVNDSSARELVIEYWVTADNVSTFDEWVVYHISIPAPKMMKVK